MMEDVRAVDHAILWSNLLLLFCLSLIPFATIWIGTKGLSSDSTAIYAATCLLPALSFTALWTAVRRANPQAVAVGDLSKQVVSVSLYLAAVPLAFWRPTASLVCIGAVGVLWILPPRSRRVAHAEHPAQGRPE